MALVPVDNVGQYGIVKDQNPWQLPPNVWSDGNNVKTDEGSIKKALGYASVMETVPVAPYYITHLVSGVNEYWVIGGTAAIHVYDNTSKTDTLNGAINSSVTTITLDSTTDFETAGTVTIGSEEITYTGKSATQFTGCTRGANSSTAASHLDGAVVTRTKKWYDITRASGAYSTTAAENWAATVIGGVLIMTNKVDDPQYWALAAGVPATAQKMQDLNNWPSVTALDGAITSTSSTSNITVDSTTTFPSSGTFTIDSEDISYTGKTATTFTGISRAQNSTTGATHLDDASVFVNVACKAIRSFRSFLVALNVTKSSVKYPRLVKWSTEAATQTTPTSWDETSATVDAGEYELADSKGEILDGLQLEDNFMIYKEDSIYSMQYVGTPFIFAFRQISPTIGAIAKNCVAEYPGGHAIFGNGDFYINDGRTIKPILPPKLRSYVFSTIDGEAISRSFVVADYGRSEMLFCFSQDGGVTGQPDRAIVWNWNQNTFTIRNLPGLGHIGYGNVIDPNSLTTWGAMTSPLAVAVTSTSAVGAIVTVDDASSFEPSGDITINDEQMTYTSRTGTVLTISARGVNSTTAATHAVDAVAYNGPTWTTVSGPWTMSYPAVENVLMFASPENTKIYRDNSGFKEDTTLMNSFVERTGLSMNSQGQPDYTVVKNITAIYPKMDIDSSNTINVYLGTQMSTEEGITWGSAVAFNPDSQSKVSVRGSGKYYAVKFESDTNMDWRLDGYALEVQDAGRRGSRSY
jgi:hypothetical protein